MKGILLLACAVAIQVATAMAQTGTVTNAGTLDLTFDTSNGPLDSPQPPLLSSVWSVLPLRNGQVVIGGLFAQVEGLEWPYLARLNPEGSLDQTFTARPNSTVRAMVEQPDGKILIAGDFNGVNGQFRDRVARLEPDGSLDTNFTVRLGLNGAMYALAAQADGKVVVGGAFHVPRVDAPWIHNLIRLEINGAIDFTFNPGTNLFTTGINVNHVKAVLVQPDGGVMAAGTFCRTNGSSRDYLARLLPDGSLDPKFPPDPLSGPNGPIYSMAAQAGGSVLIGGAFTRIHDLIRTNIARLSPKGSADESFHPPIFGGIVNSLAVDAIGRVLVVHSSRNSSGEFTSSFLVRLDGRDQPDSAFFGNSVYRVPPDRGIAAVAASADGATFIGGTFGMVDNQTRRRVARLNADPLGPPVLAAQANNVIIEPGLERAIHASFSLSALTSFQWLSDGTPLPGGTNAPLFLLYPLPGDSGDYCLVASNAFGTSTSAVISIQVRQPERPGAVDLSFASTPGANSNVLSIAETSDRKLFIGGVFSQYNANGAAQVARVGWNGELDTNFSRATNRINGPRFGARALLPLEGGKVLVATDANAETSWITRLNADGSRDIDFALNDPDHPFSLSFPIFGSLHFSALAQDEQSRILAAGPLAVTISLKTEYRPVLRMFQDGTIDDQNWLAGDRSPAFAHESALVMLVDHESNVLLGGKPFSFGSSILRLNSLGQRDPSMQVSLTLSNACTNCTAYGDLLAMVIQPDGKVVVGGRFDLVNGVPRLNLARLNAGGSIDTTFDPAPGPNASVNALALELDGKVLAGGAFTNVGGLARNRLARLKSDGRVDPTFDIGTGANDEITALLIRRDGRIVVGGRFTRFNGYPRGRVTALHSGPAEMPTLRSVPTNFSVVAGHPLTLAPLVGGYPPPPLQWLLNGIPIAGETNSILSIARAQVGSSGTYSLVGANASGISTNVVADVTVQPTPLQAGVIDPSFDPGLGADGDVNTIVVQEDGRILLGGSFRQIHGVSRAGIARLLEDGSLDASFNPGTGLSEMPSNSIAITRILLQPDGKIIAGGTFGKFDGITRSGVVRLHANGDVDLDYPNMSGGPRLIQPDGKLLLSAVVVGLVRRLQDGTIDPGFKLDTNINSNINHNNIYAAALQPDGRIIIVGDFYGNIARLMPDGSRDSSFDPRAVLGFRSGDVCFRILAEGSGTSGGSWALRAVVVQPDGRILIGGAFSAETGESQWNLVRLLPSGAADYSFNRWGGPNFAVRSIAVQHDGKILIGGCFTNVVDDGAYVYRHHVARLHPNGRVDSSFNPGAGFFGSADGWVEAIALQPDGRIALGGQFSHVDGARRNNIARLGGDVQMFDPMTDGQTFTTQIATVEGHTYWLEFKTALSDGEWTVTASVPGDGTVKILADSGAQVGPRFYRVRAE